MFILRNRRARDRVLLESANLTRKIVDLQKFIDDPKNADFYQLGLLKKQLLVMHEYATILDNRILTWVEP